MSLLRGFALAQACLDRFEIVLDVGVAGVAGLRLQQRLAGAARIAAQHIGVAPVIEDLRRGTWALGGVVLAASAESDTNGRGRRRAATGGRRSDGVVARRSSIGLRPPRRNTQTLRPSQQTGDFKLGDDG